MKIIYKDTNVMLVIVIYERKFSDMIGTFRYFEIRDRFLFFFCEKLGEIYE